MPVDERYRRQVALLVRTLPFIAEEPCFALKGGTAINLFIRDLPRLSVDIDPDLPSGGGLGGVVARCGRDASPNWRTNRGVGGHGACPARHAPRRECGQQAVRQGRRRADQDRADAGAARVRIRGGRAGCVEGPSNGSSALLRPGSFRFRTCSRASWSRRSTASIHATYLTSAGCWRGKASTSGFAPPSSST